MLRSLLATAALIATAPLPLHAQALTTREQAAIDRAVTTALRETGVPSASVAVVRGGKLVMTRAWGKQSERGGAPDPALPYQIASV